MCDVCLTAPGTKEPSEATQRVFQEEFEGVDLSAEIAKLMAEEASTGHSMFAAKAFTPSEPPAGAADMGLRSILEYIGGSEDAEKAVEAKTKKNKKKKKRK